MHLKINSVTPGLWVKILFLFLHCEMGGGGGLPNLNDVGHILKVSQKGIQVTKRVLKGDQIAF